MAGPRKNLQNKSSHMTGKRYFESMLDILSRPGSTMSPPWLGPEKNCQSEGSQMAGRRNFETRYCKKR